MEESGGTTDDGRVFIAGPAEAGRRLDRVLADRYPDTPRARFKDWIESGEVRVDGAGRKPAYRIREGEEIRLSLPPPEEIRIPPEPIPLRVIAEDDQILVIDKQAGLTVHPAPHQPTGTLVNALLHRGVPLSDFNQDRFRPGIVHRLDRGTSGVMVVAKTRKAHKSLGAQFERRTVRKEYRAVVLGAPEHEEGEIDLPLGKDRRVQGKMAVRQDVGRTALTRFRVLERFPRFAYLACFPATGRTHQIRVHLSALGHPVAADAVYRGGPPDVTESFLRGEAPDEGEKPVIARPALHAFRIEFDHPATGARERHEAPLHPDMTRLLEIVRRL
jgi:23S rRNA pseudouridine1911/1915/1917 synthase